MTGVIDMKKGYALVVSLILLVAIMLFVSAIFIKASNTVKRVSMTAVRLFEEETALKALVITAAYLRSKYDIISGFSSLTFSSIDQQKYDSLKTFVLKTAGPKERHIWEEDVFARWFDGTTLMKDLKEDSELVEILENASEKGLINDPQDLEIACFPDRYSRRILLLYVKTRKNVYSWALLGPLTYGNFAVFLPNGMPKYIGNRKIRVNTYYGDGEVIDGPAWFGYKDDYDHESLGIGGSVGPRFYGRVYYYELLNFSNLDEEEVFVGGQKQITMEEVNDMKKPFELETYGESILNKVPIMNINDILSSSNVSTPTGIRLIYSKAPGGPDEDATDVTNDIFVTSQIITSDSTHVQLLEIRGNESANGYDNLIKVEDQDGNPVYWQYDILVHYPGPPNCRVTVIATSIKNDIVETHMSNIESFNGLFIIRADKERGKGQGAGGKSPNAQVAIGKEGEWIENIFMGSWTMLVTSSGGPQDTGAPHDKTSIYSDIKYYSVSDIVDDPEDPEWFDTYPFDDEGNPIPDLDVTITKNGTEVTGKQYWEVWYRRLRKYTNDHLDLITTGKIIIPYHEAYDLGYKYRDLQIHASIYAMYKDREGPGSQSSQHTPTFVVKLEGLSKYFPWISDGEDDESEYFPWTSDEEKLGYRFVFGSIAVEEMTPTWQSQDGHSFSGLKEFNSFDKRLYTYGLSEFSPETGLISLEGIRVR